MKTPTFRWLLVATAATALLGCSRGEIPQGVASDDTVAPIDGDSSAIREETAAGAETRSPAETAAPDGNPDAVESATVEQLPSSEDYGAAIAEEMLANADLSIFEKYGINPEDARKAWDESMTWAAGPGADATDEEEARQGEAILAKYGIDAENFGKAIAEMMSAGLEEADQADVHAAEAQPLDGGEHTWPNGVHLALRVVKQEPWGTTDDYCGNGSCGISNPDDLRWVLRYDVTVPDSFAGEFDPYGCPGQLHIVDGNDDDALIGVAGADATSIDGILPGATKYGQDEYSIERTALGSEFYIESSCGDTEFGGDTVYFRGVIGSK